MQNSTKRLKRVGKEEVTLEKARLSATRIMRSRFLPSSLGVVTAGGGGKKICHAARSLREKSTSGATSGPGGGGARCSCCGRFTCAAQAPRERHALPLLKRVTWHQQRSQPARQRCPALAAAGCCRGQVLASAAAGSAWPTRAAMCTIRSAAIEAGATHVLARPAAAKQRATPPDTVATTQMTF